MDKKTRLYLTYSMGIYQLVMAFAPELAQIYNGKFVLASDLPLEMCGLSGILAGIVIFYRNQTLFEFLYFWNLWFYSFYHQSRVYRGRSEQFPSI